jgi:hypothetical protein
MTRRALLRLSDLCWLDPTCEWFTLINCDSSMKATFAKILDVGGDVDREDLVVALGKGRSFRDVPVGVVRAYVNALVDSFEPSPRRGTGRRDAVVLTREERVLVEFLRYAGGDAELETLRREARQSSITPGALKRTLSCSPLFLRVTRARYRLIGSGAPLTSRPLLSSGQWEARI